MMMLVAMVSSPSLYANATRLTLKAGVPPAPSGENSHVNYEFDNAKDVCTSGIEGSKVLQKADNTIGIRADREQRQTHCEEFVGWYMRNKVRVLASHKSNTADSYNSVEVPAVFADSVNSHDGVASITLHEALLVWLSEAETYALKYIDAHHQDVTRRRRLVVGRSASKRAPMWVDMISKSFKAHPVLWGSALGCFVILASLISTQIEPPQPEEPPKTDDNI